MADYNTEQAWNIFQQFDATIPTLYYANGTDADALNKSTEDFGSYSVGPSDQDIAITNPWDPSVNKSSYDGYKYPIDKPPQQTDQSKLVMYLAIAGVAISLLALVRR